MDEQVNSEQQEGTPTETTGPNPVNKESQPTAKVYTKDEVERLVQERIAKVKNQYGDYDDLKKAAQKLQEIEDAKKSELDKLTERMAKMEEARKQLEGENARLAQEKQAALIRAEVVAKATTLNFNDPSDAYRMLDLSAIKVGEDGKTEGIDELLKALAEAKPYLLRAEQKQSSLPTPKLGATNPPQGGAGKETDQQRRARLFGLGSTPFGTAQGGGMIHPEGNENQ